MTSLTGASSENEECVCEWERVFPYYLEGSAEATK